MFKTIREASEQAKKKIRKNTFTWLEAAAEDGFTNRINFLDLNNCKILPKLLFGKGKKIQINKNFLGLKLKYPLLISPMGHQSQFHKNGEIETGAGALKAEICAFFGTQSRFKLEDIRKKNKNLLLGWEIFPFGSLDWIFSQVDNAIKNKCFAVCLCLDANIRSHRYTDIESRYDARKYGKRTNPISPNPDYALNYDWSLIKKIKEKFKIKIIAKGILTPNDASNAMNSGCDAIWVSNHGGRMLNSGISSLNALLSIKKIKKLKKIPTIVDGGVRRGSDVIKYLCAGADLVGIGRPAIYGLISQGSYGVKNVIEILISEIKTAMLNGGFRSSKDFTKKRILFKKG